MKRLQLITRVDPELREAVSKAAGDEGISINDLVIKALENYLGIPQDSTAITTDNSSAIATLAERITALESNAINGDNSTDSISVINDRFQALESKIEGIEQQLKAIVESGKTPPKTDPKAPPKTKTIALGEGTIADQILQLMADGREWGNKELGTHFPGKRITSALSRLKGKGAIEQVKSESGKEIPGVHRIVKA